MGKVLKKNTKKELYEKIDVPNKKTIKAMEDTELFEAENADQMIADCLGDQNWEQNLYHSNILRKWRKILNYVQKEKYIILFDYG